MDRQPEARSGGFARADATEVERPSLRPGAVAARSGERWRDGPAASDRHPGARRTAPGTGAERSPHGGRDGPSRCDEGSHASGSASDSAGLRGHHPRSARDDVPWRGTNSSRRDRRARGGWRPEDVARHASEPESTMTSRRAETPDVGIAPIPPAGTALAVVRLPRPSGGLDPAPAPNELDPAGGRDAGRRDDRTHAWRGRTDVAGWRGHRPGARADDRRRRTNSSRHGGRTRDGWRVARAERPAGPDSTWSARPRITAPGTGRRGGGPAYRTNSAPSHLPERT
jgi:hypothetical protein